MEHSRNSLNEPYPNIARARCDVYVRRRPALDWCIEVKMLRIMGDNGKPNDNMLMHILSRYPVHRRAVTDVAKMASSGFPGRKAILICGYDYDLLPIERPAIAAFERLANADGHRLGSMCCSSLDGLLHPIHTRGAVCGWEVLA